MGGGGGEGEKRGCFNVECYKTTFPSFSPSENLPNHPAWWANCIGTSQVPVRWLVRLLLSILVHYVLCYD